MTRGVLIFAHNSKDVDYGLLSIIAAGLAKKNLNVPISLVTDKFTIEWMRTSGIYEKALSVFDTIITVDKPNTPNHRMLRDGDDATSVPFINSNRASVWELTPYDSTLLIDSDFLILSDRLNSYWDVDADVMIGNSMNDIKGERVGVLDKNVSETGIHMYWATTVMFKKTEKSRFFFELVNYIKTNYKFYADIFRFDSRQFRNDIAFSVAQHILNGFEEDHKDDLPSILTVLDKDILHEVTNKGNLIFLLNSMKGDNKFTLTSISNVDVHVMNKQSIVRNSQQLLTLI